MIENFLPPSIVELVVKRDPSPMRKASRLPERVANSLIEAKAQALIEGKGSRDVFSLLGESRLGITHKYKYLTKTYFNIVEANKTESEKTRTPDDVMVSQMRYVFFYLKRWYRCTILLTSTHHRTIIFAGFVTTATSLTWLLILIYIYYHYDNATVHRDGGEGLRSENRSE